MCDECGCNDIDAGLKRIEVSRSVNDFNDVLAGHVSDFLKSKGIFCVNIMGSPGAGKTTLIEGLAKHISPVEIAVIQGDLESDVDRERLLKAGIYAYQINTHSGCHLNASMVNRALLDMDLNGRRFVFIENVGNLVCPAGVRIGQHMDVVVSSTAEGCDKPRKYPLVFIDAGMVVVSKLDISDACGFDEHSFVCDIRKVNPKVKLVRTCVKKDESFLEAAHFIEHKREHFFGIEHGH